MKKIIALVLCVVMVVCVFAACAEQEAASTEEPASTEEAASTEEPAEAADTEEAPAASEEAAADSSSDETLNITFVSPLIGLPVWLNAKYGAEAAAQEENCVVSWVGPSEIDMDEQVRQIELAMAEGVDGIICCPLSPSIFEDVYKQAMDKGIFIINTAVDSAEDTRNAYIGTDYVNFGEQAAENIGQKLGGKGNIAVLVTSLDSENQMSEMKAGEDYLAKNYPDIKIVVTEVTNSDTAQAADVTSALIDAYPDLSCIWCLESAAPLGAAQTVNERGLTDKIAILGIDDTEDVLDLVDQGLIWGTMTQDFYKMGYESVKMIRTLHDGGTVPSVQDSGTTLVTKDNLEEYKNRF